MRVLRFLFVTLAFLSFVFADCADPAHDIPLTKKVLILEDTVFVGDRILDIANTLNIMPKFAAARFSQWNKSFSFQTKRLGCPNKVTRRDKTIIPKLIDNKGVKNIVIEKTNNFCLIMKKVNPMNVVDIVKDKKVNIKIIDFSKSQREGIIAIAKYLGKEKEGIKLADKYEKELKEAKASMNSVKKDKRVVILKSSINKKTKKLTLRAESKGFYTDKMFLNSFGAKNVSDLMNIDKKRLFKGSFPVKELKSLLEAKPDVIILFGKEKAKAKAKAKILQLAKADTKFAKIPAIKNNALADNLKYYIGSDIADAPQIISTWVKFFKNLK